MKTQTNNTGSGVTGGNNPAVSDNSGGGAITTAALTKALTRAFTLTRQMTDERVILQANGVARNLAVLEAADSMGGIYLLEEEGYFVRHMPSMELLPGGSVLAADDTSEETSGSTGTVEILGEPYNYTVRDIGMADQMPDYNGDQIVGQSDTASASARGGDDAAGLDPVEKSAVRAYDGRLCLVPGRDARTGLFITTAKMLSNPGGLGIRRGMSLALVAYLDDNTAADALAFAFATQAAMVDVVARFRMARYLFSDASEEAEQWRQQLTEGNSQVYYIDESGAVQRVTFRRVMGISRVVWGLVPEGLAMFAGQVISDADTRQLYTPSADNSSLVPWVLPRDVVVDFDHTDENTGWLHEDEVAKIDYLISAPHLVNHYIAKFTSDDQMIHHEPISIQLPSPDAIPGTLNPVIAGLTFSCCQITDENGTYWTR